MMTREEVIKKMQEHNESINRFYEEEAPRLLNFEYGQEMPADKWFGIWAGINSLAREKKFYEKAMTIVKEAQAEGYDIRVNAQSDKVVGLGIHE